jgi:ABC-type uncharacterized transport system involved in gliding motility auxiliary subunit
MDERHQVLNVATGQSYGPFDVTMPIKIPNQIQVESDTINKDVNIVNRLPSLFCMWAADLEVTDDVIDRARLKKTVLFTSSARSWRVMYAFQKGFLDREFFDYPKGSEGRFPIALMLEGVFNGDFSKKKVPAWPLVDSGTGAEESGKTEGGSGLAKEDGVTSHPARLIVVGCSEMFTDSMISAASNLNFFANTVDALSLGDDILQIQPQLTASRDIKKLTDMQKILYRFAAVGLIPVFLILFAAIRFVLRAKEKQFYLMVYRSQSR